MTDTLTTGSERLEKRIRLEHPLAVNTPKLQAIIKADPGIAALVGFAGVFVGMPCHCSQRGKGDCNGCLARASLKKWETGE